MKVKLSRRFVLILMLVGALHFLSTAQFAQKYEGLFKPNKESFHQYKYPAWFRDAKFGIWAHWGPQAVPRQGDWYARKMYEEGSDDYKYHVEHYGHPSKFGYKDIIPLWKAERWDPEKLMALYKKAGAKYFVSMGTHHDDFFLWNSKIHKWNAVNYGPKKMWWGYGRRLQKAKAYDLAYPNIWRLVLPGFVPVILQIQPAHLPVFLTMVPTLCTRICIMLNRIQPIMAG